MTQSNKELIGECRSCGENIELYSRGLCRECYDYALSDLQLGDI